MKTTTEDRDGIHVLRCEGALALGISLEAFDAACRQCIGKGRGIVLDLSGVPYIDSTGIATVVAWAKRTAERGTAMKVVLSADGAVRRAFEITQLDQVFEVFGDAETAVASFS